MTTKRFAIVGIQLLLGLLLMSTTFAGRAESMQSPIDQGAIAKRLLSDIPLERQEAFGQAISIEPANRGPALRAALIALLERHNKLVAQALQRGLTVDQVENPEFVAAVERAVAELKDPASIPALAGALRSFHLIQPLADFGEAAAPSVIAVVMSPQSHYNAVDDALRVLRFMVEKQQSRPISPATLVQIRRATQERLQGTQKFTTLWYAIDLAAVLGDSELRHRIEDLANHPSEVTARGVIEPRLIAQTQKRAADRLAGMPAMPRPK